MSSREPGATPAVDVAIQDFKERHPELMDRAAKDPVFARVWDRAVRFRVTHPPASSPPTTPATARANLRREVRRLEVQEREARAREQAAIDAEVAAAKERQDRAEEVRRANERAEADRIEALNAVNTIKLPVSLGPMRDLSIRRRLINEIEHAATELRDEPQASDG